MTIQLGAVTVTGSTAFISPSNGQFGAVEAVRLTNYTGEVLVLQGISGTGQGEEYLMALQQMVYHTRNVSNRPGVRSLGTTFLANTDLLYVEFSDDAINDFIGTYPVPVPLLP